MMQPAELNEHSEVQPQNQLCSNVHKQIRVILIVEDDEVVSEVMCMYIKQTGLYAVDVVTNMHDARVAFSKGHYFMVMLDLNIDGSIENGIKLATEFRAKDDNVILSVVTGYYPIFDRRLIESIDDILQKPVSCMCIQNKLIMWEIQWMRRISTKHYVDSKIDSYIVQLMEIKDKELVIDTKIEQMINRISNMKMFNGYLHDG